MIRSPSSEVALEFEKMGEFLERQLEGKVSGLEKALQQAVDQGGTIIVSQPGMYNIARTVYVGSNTALEFGQGVLLRKVAEPAPFTHVLLNKGALTRTWDHNIQVRGLHVIVNDVDVRDYDVYGLNGQLAFFYVKDLRIERFRCLDLGKLQFAIHICTFEDIIIDDVIIKGKKDGVHLGRGKRFTIRNGVFQTYDDAVALNAHDWSIGNPELGWIENGVVEKCWDLYADKPIGFFCRILGGGWLDWQSGMTVQQSDTVVSNGRLYRVQADPDGTIYTSTTQPMHESGQEVLDGITWGMVQDDVVYTAGVRNVIFRDIFLEKPRVPFAFTFSNNRYSRSYYPGAHVPRLEQFTFENIHVLHDQPVELMAICTPLDVVTLTNSSIRNNLISFHQNSPLPNPGKTAVTMIGCNFRHDGPLDLITNTDDKKVVQLKTAVSTELGDNFSARVLPGKGTITTESDLTGLKA